jgi:hypothetical protein
MEETKEMEKFIKAYNNFMLAKKIEEVLEFPLVFLSIVTAFVLFFRLQEGINLLTFFMAIFIIISPLFLNEMFDWKYAVFIPKNFERFLIFVEFLEEEELEGMELGKEEAAKFAEWKEKKDIILV